MYIKMDKLIIIIINNIIILNAIYIQHNCNIILTESGNMARLLPGE